MGNSLLRRILGHNRHEENVIAGETNNDGDFAYLLFAAGIVDKELRSLPMLAGSPAYAVAEIE